MAAKHLIKWKNVNLTVDEEFTLTDNPANEILNSIYEVEFILDIERGQATNYWLTEAKDLEEKRLHDEWRVVSQDISFQEFHHFNSRFHGAMR